MDVVDIPFFAQANALIFPSTKNDLPGMAFVLQLFPQGLSLAVFCRVFDDLESTHDRL